jgi:hypothetical protein
MYCNRLLGGVMTNREEMRKQIESMRGEFIDEVVYTYAFHDRTIEIVGFGFENYPEADFYRVRDNGNYLDDTRDGDSVYSAALHALTSTRDTIYINVMDAVEYKEFSW